MIRPPRSIAVTRDFSRFSRAAFPVTASLARHWDAAVHLIHVVPSLEARELR